MKFIIEGRTYDVEQGVKKASLATLYELKLRHGIGIKTLQQMCRELAKFDDPVELLEHKDAFQALRVVIWLARKGQGDKIGSLDDATSFPIDQMEIVIDDDDEPVAEGDVDPKAAAVSAPVASAGAATTPST